MKTMRIFEVFGNIENGVRVAGSDGDMEGKSNQRRGTWVERMMDWIRHLTSDALNDWPGFETGDWVLDWSKSRNVRGRDFAFPLMDAIISRCVWRGDELINFTWLNLQGEAAKKGKVNA